MYALNMQTQQAEITKTAARAAYLAASEDDRTAEYTGTVLPDPEMVGRSAAEWAEYDAEFRASWAFAYTRLGKAGLGLKGRL